MVMEVDGLDQSSETADVKQGWILRFYPTNDVINQKRTFGLRKVGVMGDN